METYEEMVAALNQNRELGVYPLPENASQMGELVEPPPKARRQASPRQRLAERVQVAREHGQLFVSVTIEELEAVLHDNE